MLLNPRVHGDTRSDSSVDRPRRAELADGAAFVNRVSHGVGQARPLLTEDENAALREGMTFEAGGPCEVVDPDERQLMLAGEGVQVINAGMVANVLIAISNHGPAPVPSSTADDVDLGGEERVCRADHGSDVEIVLPVLDGDVEAVTSRVEVGSDCFDRPVAVAIDDIAAIAIRQQVGVVARAGGPWPRMGADADLSHEVFGLRLAADGGDFGLVLLIVTHRFSDLSGRPPGARTRHLGIKSPLLYQMS